MRPGYSLLIIIGVSVVLWLLTFHALAALVFLIGLLIWLTSLFMRPRSRL